MFASEVYVQRRKRLCEELSVGLVLLPGHSESPINYADNTYPFRQNSHFLYLAGIDLPDLFLMIDVEAGISTLYGDEPDMNDLLWTGPVPKPSDLASQAGIEQVKPFRELYSDVQKAQTGHRKLHFLPPYRAETALLLGALIGIPVSELAHRASLELIRTLILLRSVKGPEELKELDLAAEIGYDLHMAVLLHALPGISEQELVALAEKEVYSQGVTTSFSTILSQRGEVVHGHSHQLILEKGRFLLCDAGAESPEHYASDFTRTMPVGGRFSASQKAIYQVVLSAYYKGFELISPGIPFKDVHLACCLELANGLKSLGLMQGDMEEAVREGAHALFMVHGIGHMLGLDVHDMEDLGEDLVGYDQEISRSSQFGLSSLRLGRRLQPGFAITIEPGIYFIPELIDRWEREKRFTSFIRYNKVHEYRKIGGIRLEDNAVITQTGYLRPGYRRLPITPEAIEGLYSQAAL
jgi:Xaa-Pro aminopeptidase